MFRKLKVYLQAVENRAFETDKISFFFLSGVEVLQVLGVEVYYRRLDRVKCKVI
jgi:hypothetical protein